MDEHVTGPHAIDRRGFIRKAALTTGVVWAAPTVTTVSRALGAEGSSAPRRTSGPCEDGTTYRFKYEMAQGEPGAIGSFETGDINDEPAGSCTPPAGIDDATDVILGGEQVVDEAGRPTDSWTRAFIPTGNGGTGEIVAREATVDGKWVVEFALPLGTRIGGLASKAGQGCSTEYVLTGDRSFVIDGVDQDVSNVSVVLCSVPVT